MELTIRTMIVIAAVLTVIGTGMIYFYAVMNKPVHVITVQVIGNGKVSLGSFGAYTTIIQVTDGQSLTITAQPDQGWAFSQWSGDVSGAVNPMSLVVTKDLRIVAIFTK